MSAQYILQLETATQVCSAALSADGQTIAYRDIDEPNVHASRLTLLVKTLLQETGLSFADLHAVAVSKGPGSYTGLRIGVSVAKGFCYATDLPLIGVGTLEAMARGFAASHAEALRTDTWFCPMIDARRMEVYTAAYGPQLQQVRPIEARIIDQSSFASAGAAHRIALFGSGADKFAALFAGHPAVMVVPGFKNSASHLSQLAYEAFQAGDFVDVAYFEPYYLKDFVATTPKQRS